MYQDQNSLLFFYLTDTNHSYSNTIGDEFGIEIRTAIHSFDDRKLTALCKDFVFCHSVGTVVVGKMTQECKEDWDKIIDEIIKEKEIYKEKTDLDLTDSQKGKIRGSSFPIIDADFVLC